MELALWAIFRFIRILFLYTDNHVELCRIKIESYEGKGIIGLDFVPVRSLRDSR